jgi:DNA-binding transcriptional MocR family regulator
MAGEPASGYIQQGSAPPTARKSVQSLGVAVDTKVPRSKSSCLDLSPDDRYTRVSRGLHAIVKTPREFELAVALISYRWFPDSPIIPSVRTLAGMLRCSERTVRRTAARMQARGLLIREERRAIDDRQLSNRYVLCGPLLALVTAVETRADQEASPSWQGRRTAVAGERTSGNQTQRTRPSERPDHRDPDRDFLATRYGPLKPRT